MSYIAGSIVTALLGLVIFTQTAHAATFTVNDTGDASAVDPTVSCNTAGDVCTLRSAIEAANAQAGADTINFNISGAGVHTITPTTDYDPINEPTTIDATTQPGSSCGTLVPASLPANSNTPHTLLIELNGTNVGGSVIDIEADNSTVKGFVINRSQNGSINASGSNNLVECNYLNTNPAGDAAGGGTNSSGVYVGGGATVQNNLVSGNTMEAISSNGNNVIQNNLIGTTANGISALNNSAAAIHVSHSDTVAHNIIANSVSGIVLSNGQTGFTIRGNYIGVAMNGSAAGNSGDGINVGSGNYDYTIGGSGAGQGNVISANTGNGLVIYNNTGSSCPDNIISTVYGNYIGTNSSGNVQSGFGNQGSGIVANEEENRSCEGSVYKHKIGGPDSGQGNIVAGNAQDGVRIYEAIIPNSIQTDVFGIPVVGNTIHSNGNLGINLATDSDNDGVADTDLGPNSLNNYLIDYPASYANNYLNRPSINSTSISGNDITVNYDFQAPPGVAPSGDGISLLPTDLVGYRLDFYINSGAQDGAYAGYSQGATHLGSFVVDGPETGATHTFTSPVALTGTQNVTVSATILWKIITCEDSGNVRQGDGPPYSSCMPPP